MMLSIVYVTHSTSTDNEAGIASGHNDPDLSATGEQLAAELGIRYEGQEITAVYCFDLKRAYRTAEIGFGSRDIPIIRDPRCREVDYGTLTGRPLVEIDAVRVEYVDEPFPDGESYRAATDRLRHLLDDAHAKHAGETLILIGNRATYIGLQHLCRGVPLEEAAADPRPWQEQWRYVYDPKSD